MHRARSGSTRAMPRRRSAGARRRGPARVLAILAALAVPAAILLGVSPAQAAPQKVNAQLALSGVATADSPAGGSQIGVHPGDSVSFAAAGVPTAGLAKLGLGDLVGTVDNLLSGATSFQVRANFAGLPRGHKNTVLKGKRTAKFTFARAGTYHFTWTVEKVTVISGLLGNTTKVSTINLNGNELRQAGIKLNAKNQYVGEVVVRKHPPKGGISIQLPSVGAHPSAPVVGQLPSAGVPGTALPTIPVSVPNVSAPNVPGLPGSSSSSNGGGGGNGGGSGGSGGGKNFSGPPTSVPQLVVPKGDNALVLPGGDNAGALPVYNGSSGFLPGSSGAGAAAGNGGKVRSQPALRDAAQPSPVDLAGNGEKTSDPSGQLPVLLAIIAIITLALVAGTYARLFLIRRNF